MHTVHHRRGFTLIELSIVLVIIGLLVGSIVSGKEMIKSADIRRTLTQKERFDTAVHAFKTKYDCLPGDCANPTRFGFANYSGNGNGKLDATGVYDEMVGFWRHLNSAGLLSSDNYNSGNTAYDGLNYVPGYQSPSCPICLKTTFQYGGGPTVSAGGWGMHHLGSIQGMSCTAGWATPNNYVQPSYNAWSLSGHFMQGGSTPPVISAFDAATIDGKIDDGIPVSGGVMVTSAYLTVPAGCGGGNYMSLGFNPASFNVSGGNYAYKTAVTDSGCWQPASTAQGACFDLLLKTAW